MMTSLILTLAGFTGAGGALWAAALFVPTVANVLRVVVDFIRSPIGTVAAAVVAGLVLYSSGYVAGDIHGSNGTRAAWRADIAARQQAAARRDLALQLDMKRVVDAAAGADDQFSKHIDERVASNAAKDDSSACRRATDDDVRRLLSIR